LPNDLTPRTDDVVQPFQLDPFALRGRLVRLGPTVDRILQQHDYPEPVATLLGEAITLAVMLAGALKYDGVFTLQTKGDGPVRMLVADVKTDGAVRGYAQYDSKRLGEIAPEPAGESPSVPRLLGAGYIAFTVDQGDDTERYQGIVSITGGTLAECAQHYFRQSEQLQAGLKLAVARAGEEGAWRAGGLMLQRVPPEGGRAHIADDVEDAWRRVMVLMSSATPAELVAPDLPPRRLLWRLFHDDGVRVYQTHAVEARCRCSRERIAGILKAFPSDEIDEMKKEAVTTVTCEFCNTRYEFAAAELAQIAQA
jgi:molecular chaperone Hsp33